MHVWSVVLTTFVLIAGFGGEPDSSPLKTIKYRTVSELAEDIKSKLPADFKEPVLIAEDVHVTFNVADFGVISGGMCKDCEVGRRHLVAERKENVTYLSAVIINEAAVAMAHFDVQLKGRDVQLTGKLNVYPPSENHPQGRLELYVENVRDVVVVPKK